MNIKQEDLIYLTVKETGYSEKIVTLVVRSLFTGIRDKLRNPTGKNILVNDLITFNFKRKKYEEKTTKQNNIEGLDGSN